MLRPASASISALARQLGVSRRWMWREFKRWVESRGEVVYDYYVPSASAYVVPLEFVHSLLGGGIMVRVRKGPTVRKIDEWIRKLKDMSPQEIVEFAREHGELRQIRLWKNGRFVVEGYELTLEASENVMVVADTNGIIEANVNGEFVTLPLDAYRYPGAREVYEKLKQLLGVVVDD